MSTDKTRARVFISYSRRDLDRAEPLRDALNEAGFDAYLDIVDIAPGEPWRERLGALIASAEKVVFLISPASVASEICTWEVDTAEAYGKSVLPVLIHDTDEETIPGRLRRLNFVFLRDQREAITGAQKLVTALSTDLAWEREKTRVNDLATAWDNSGRSARRLLLGDGAIREAETWRDTHPSSAPPPTALQLAFIDASRRAQARRLRRLVAAAGVAAVATTGLAAVAFQQRMTATQNAEVAEARAEEARLARAEAEAQADQARSARAEAEVRSAEAQLTESRFLAGFSTEYRLAGDGAAALALARAALPKEFEAPERPLAPEAVAALYNAWLNLRELDAIRELSEPRINAPPVVLEDGRRILTRDESGALRIRRFGDPAPMLTIEPDPPIAATAFSGDEARLAVAHENGAIRVWDIASASVAFEHDLAGAPAQSLAFSPRGGRLAVGAADARARILDIGGEGEPVEGQPAQVETVQVETVQVETVQVETVQVEQVYPPMELYGGYDETLMSVSFEGDGAYLATSAQRRVAENGYRTLVAVWNAETGEKIAQINETGAAIELPYAISADGELLAFADVDNMIHVIDLLDGSEFDRFEGHDARITRLAFSPNGVLLASGAAARSGLLANPDEARAPGKAFLWHLPTGRRLAALEGDGGDVVGLDFSKQGSRLAVAWRSRWDNRQAPPGADPLRFGLFDMDAVAGGLWLFDPRTGAQIGSVRADPQSALDTPFFEGRGVEGASFNADGSRALVEGAGRSSGNWAPLLDTTTGEVIATLDDALFARFTPDGERVVAGYQSGALKMFDAETGDEMGVFVGHDAAPRGVSFDASGYVAITTAEDNTARRWSVQPAGAATKLELHERTVSSVAFSPDGRKVALSSWDKTASIWDPRTGEALRSIRGFETQLTGAYWAPDNRRVLLTGVNGVGIVWDTETGETPRGVGSHSGAITGARWTEDGRYIVTVGLDGLGILWDAAADPAGPDDIDVGLWRVMYGHTGVIETFDMNGDGSLIVTGSSDGTARLWRPFAPPDWSAAADPSAPAPELAGVPDTVPDDLRDRFVPAVQVLGAPKQFEDNPDAMFPKELPGGSSAVTSVALSSDEALAATGHVDGSARVWRVADGEVVYAFAGVDDRSASVVRFSPTADRLLVASTSGATRLIGLADGALIATLRSDEDVTSAVFSPDGRWVLTAGAYAARLWDGQTGVLAAELKSELGGFDDSIARNEAARSAIDSILHLPYGADEEANGADAGSAREGAPPTSRGRTAAFSPKGDLVGFAAGDGAVRVWPFVSDLAALAAEADRLVAALDPLTPSERCRFYLDPAETCATIAEAASK